MLHSSNHIGKQCQGHLQIVYNINVYRSLYKLMQLLYLYTLTNLVQPTDIKSECDAKVLSSLLHLRGQSHVKED